MAIKVEWGESPRIITIQLPTTDITIQELSNQIKDIEDEPAHLQYPILILTFGKQPLGAGSFVGITAVLQNARIAFAERPGPDEVLCTVTGGNLVAVDESGTTINPVHPTAFTQVTIQQSTSPSIATPPSDTSLMFLIESLRGRHTTVGNIFYWDPQSGSDSNDGTTPSTAVATFSQAQSLATAGANDIIFALSTTSSGVTTTTESIAITKANLKVRGPGYSFQISPSVPGIDSVSILADNAEFSGFFVETAAGGSDTGIAVTSDNVLVKDVWVNGTTGHGIEISSTARTTIDTCAIENCTGNGINIGASTSLSTIRKCIITGNADGVDLTGSGITDNIFETNLIYNNTGSGIDIGSGVIRTGIRLNHTFAGNGSNITDNGTGTFQDTSGTITQGDIDSIVDGVWDEVIGNHVTAGTTGRTLRDAKTRATLASLK